MDRDQFATTTFDLLNIAQMASNVRLVCLVYAFRSPSGVQDLPPPGSNAQGATQAPELSFKEQVRFRYHCIVKSSQLNAVAQVYVLARLPRLPCSVS